MRTIVAVALFTVALAGCFEGGQGSLSVYIKDSVVDELSGIVVLCGKVQVHGDDGWITVLENESGIEIDLLAAQGDLAAFLGEIELEAGNYTQIRLTILAATAIDHDGIEHDVTVSSGTLKVVRGFEINEGSETRVIVDVDLERSLRQQGNGDWRMTPVIGKTFVQEVDDDGSGSEAHQPGEITSVLEAA